MNTVVNVTVRVAGSLISFLLVPFLVHRLGEESYGVWALVGTVFSYSVWIQMGLSSGVSRYVPMFLAKGDVNGLRQALASAIYFFLVVSVVLVGITLLFYYNLGRWFAIPASLLDQGQTLTLLVGGFWAATILFQPFSAALVGLQRYDIAQLAGFSATVARAVLFVVFVARGCGLVAMGIISGVCLLASRLVESVFATKLLGRDAIALRAASFSLFREMSHFGANTILYELGGVIIYRASNIVIGMFMTSEDVARYSVVTATLIILSSLLQALSAAVLPAVADLDARDEPAKIKMVSLLMQKYSLILLIPSIAFLMIMGKEFLSIWIGGDFGELAVVLQVLCVGHLLRLAQHSNFRVLAGKGKHRFFGVLTLLMALAAVGLAVLSARVLKSGLLGVALSNCVPMVIVSGIVLPLHVRRALALSVRDGVQHVLRPALLACAPAVGLLAGWHWASPPDSWAELGCVVAGAVGLTALGAWFWALSREEKVRLLAVLHRNR